MLRAARLSTGTRAPKIALLTAFALTALALSAAPALAAPATPTLTVETLLPGGPTPAGSATLHGVLSPGVSGEPGSLYQFHYKEFKEGETPDCEGGLSAPESPGIAIGEENEPVNETIYLQPHTKYAVCLHVENLTAETATSTTETFTTAIAPETPYPREPESITATTAILNAELNPLKEGEEATYQFSYGQNGECSTAAAIEEDHGAKGEEVKTEIKELEPNRQYTFCVTEFDNAGEPGPSAPLNFRTLAPAPAVVSQAATTISPFEEHLEATVDPNNQTTTCIVEYGLTTGYGSTRPCEQVIEGTTQPVASVEGGEQPLTATLPGLAAVKGYDYRFVLTNAAHETTYGEGTFTTATALPPTIEDEIASSVTATGATLEAQVNPEFQPTSYHFQYSTSELGGVLTGTVTTLEGHPALTGGGNQPASVHTVAPLEPGTTYYYRATAENGTAPNAEGPVQSFTTPPAAETGEPTVLTSTTATLNGKLKPLNETVPAEYHFDYEAGVHCDGENRTATPSVSAGSGPGGELTATPAVIENLQPGAQYTFCLVTSNASGEQVGNPVSFTTPAAPPKLDSEEPGTVTPYEARLQAQINPDGQETHYVFEYSTAESGGVLTNPIVLKGAAILPAGTTDQTATAESGHVLEPATTYYYRAVAENATAGQGTLPLQSFTTPAAKAPELYAESAGEILATTAQLEVTLFPQYQKATVTFRYALTEHEVLHEEGFTVTAPAVQPGSIAEGFPAPTVSAQASGLLPNRQYYYRAIAENAAGRDAPFGTVQFFRTTTLPVVTTGAASTPTPNATTIAGSVNPESASTTYFIQYGGTTGYGSTSPRQTVGAGTTPVSVEVPVERLEPGRTYHYRLVAENTTGGVTYAGYGEDKTFATPATPPVITGLTAGQITQSTAVITANLNPRNLQTRYELQLGSVQGQLQPITSATTTDETAISLAVGNLTPGTTYYYRLIATNASGTVEPESVLVTLPGAAAAAPPGLPALIPYVPVSTINAKEEAENKKNSKPPALTNKQKLAKALVACHKDKKKSKRAKCERAAHKKYPVKASKSATRKS
jgi:phosphodiesterase/alkaline phosphatase D-like protein